MAEFGNISFMRAQMSKINSKIQSLNSIEKTMLIPLWARAEETMNGGLINDPLSIEIVNEIDTSVYGFNQMSKFVKNYLLTAIANRTILIDRFLNGIINEKTVVYNFGCGLDTRFARYANKVRIWYDIDMPEVIDIRNSFAKESADYKMQAINALSDNPMEGLDLSKDCVIICEGILMYFTELEVRNFLKKVIDSTQSGNMILETLGSWTKLKVNPVIKGIGENSRYTWSLNNTQDCRKLDNRMKMIETKSIFDLNKERWGLMGRLMNSDFLNKRISSKITLYRY